MLEVDDKTYEYCRNDALDTYRYLTEYMAVKPVVERPVTATEIAIEMEKLENSRRNNNMTKSDEVYLVQWRKNEDKDSVSSGNIKLLGKITNGYMHYDYDDPVTIAGNDPKNVLMLKGPTRAISAHIDISDSVWDTGDFAMILQKLAHYAELGIDASKTKKLDRFFVYNIADKFEIKKVICSGPCVIVFWDDGTKTIVRAQGTDICDYEKGLAMAFAKKCLGNKGNYCNTFKKWLIGKDWRKKEREQHKQNKILKAVEEARKAVKPKKKTDTRHKGSSHEMDHEDMGG